MSTAAVTSPLSADPKVLRPILHADVDRLPDEALEAAHQALLEIEARRLFEKLGGDFAEDWSSGRITEENLQQAILEHRRKHPYR